MKTKADLMNPFPGLRSFRSDEDYLFFGRDKQTLELMARLERNRFIAVVGTSGSGKSSLVRCGLLSRLQGGGMVGAGAHWEIAVMHPGGQPLHHLAEALLESGLHDRAQEDARPHLLATLGRSQFGLVQAVRQAALPAGTNFLLVVDQFEEIFRYDEAGEAESEVANDFIAMLREASAQTEVPIYIVTTMRSDFIGDCSRFEGLAETVNRGEYLIPGLNRDQFKAAIEGPIRVAGGQIAPRLLQRLLNDLGEEQDQLPCLQHALMRTWRVWQGRADAPALDLEDYAQVGKMSQALSVHADEVYFGLATDRQRELCAAMFKALTVEGSEKRGIRRPRRLQILCRILGVEPAELVPVIDAFRQPEVSFLVPSADVELRDTTVIDLSHESLMRVWTRLRDWVEEEAKSVGIFRRLSESATLWRQGKTGFYRDPELSIARAWLETSRPNAAWAEQYEGVFEEAMAFLQASSDAAQEEVRAQETARQHELEQARALAEAERQRAEEQTRFAGRLKWLVRGLGVVAMVAVTAMVLAFGARQAAQEHARLAEQSEHKAQAAAATMDKVRSEAEKLLSFLLEDFYDELEPTGRLETVGKLAREAVAYFDQLPAELRSPATRRNRAIAQLRLGQAEYRGRNSEVGGATIKTALADLEQMYADGDRSETTIVGLSAALRADVPLGFRAGSEEEVAKYRWSRSRSVEVLRPIASSATSSLTVRLEFANALSDLGFIPNLGVEAFAILSEAREILASAGALTGSNLRAMAAYAHVTNRMALQARTMNRAEDTERWFAEGLDLAEKVLEIQPSNLRALFVSGVTNMSLWGRAIEKDDRTEAWKRLILANDAFDLLVRSNPSDRGMVGFRLAAKHVFADMLIQEGRIDEAIRLLRTEVETVTRDMLTDAHTGRPNGMRLDIAYWEAARRNRAAADAALAEVALAEASAPRRAGEGAPGEGVRITPARAGGAEARPARAWNVQQVSLMIPWHLRDYPRLVDEARKVAGRVEALLATSNLTAGQRRTAEHELASAIFNVGRGNLFLGNWAEAERHLRRAMELKDYLFAEFSPAIPSWLAVALARQGRLAEAADVIGKNKLEDVQAAYAKGNHSLYVRWDLARGHYASALTQPEDAAGREKRGAALRQAKALLDESTDEARQLSEELELRRLIDEELALVGRASR